jgi:TolB protein
MRKALAVLLLPALSACQSGAPLQAGPATVPAASAAGASCPESAAGRCIAIVAVGRPDSPANAAPPVTARDLQHAGQFTLLDAQSSAKAPDWTQPIRYAEWKARGVDYLVLEGPADSVAGLQTIGATGETLHLRLADVRQEKIVVLDNLPITLSGAARAAHQASDLVLQQLTGTRGLFATDIAYIAVTQGGRASSYRLKISDAYGDDEKTIAESQEPLMSPTWSPDGRRIAYGGYEDGRSAVYICDLDSGKRTRLISEKGINGSPAWSPDGKTLALTLSFGHNPDIYFIDVDSGTRRRITSDAGIETETSWSPDGKAIAFTSDRGGAARVYTLDIDGGAPREMPAYGKQTSNPSFSPDGKMLAVVVNEGRDSRIGMIHLDSRPSAGSFEFISSGPRDEKPSFAPNGASLVYAAEDDRRGQLKIRAPGGSLRQIHGDEDVREPAWSPYLN